MKTTTEILQETLLLGKHLTKFDFLNLTNSVCLAQRVQELRQMGWNIVDKNVPGKGTLKEYWLEPEEIARIKVASVCNVPLKAIGQDKEMNEQIEKNIENLRETAQKVAQTEKYEQMGLGLLGGQNYGQTI